MPNRFGLKDAVVIALLLFLGLSIWLKMGVSDGRTWKAVQSIETKLGSIEQQVSRFETQLASRPAAAVAPAGAAVPGASVGGSAPAESSARDESWARPGVEVAWQPPFGFADDPRGDADYRLGGEFFEIFEAQPKKLTPILGEDVYGRRVMDQVCDRLAEYDPQSLELRGSLAEAWQYDPAGLWLRVKIRDEARFSDGKPVTAEDLRYTFHDYINNPELETESLRSILTQIQSVTVISERVAEFAFKEAGAFNLDAALQLYVLPKHFYEGFTTTQINQSTGLILGSGPFKLADLDVNDQWSPGEDIVLVRNEQYWGPKPAVQTLRYRSMDSDLSRLVTFTNNEADMILPTSTQFVEQTQQAGWSARAHSLKWTNMRSGYSFIAWQCGPRNGRLTPFSDVRVRTAMTLLLDRERMIRDIWAGIGEVAVGPNNPPSPAADPSIAPLPFDPERAKALLAEAGWTDRDGDGVLESEAGTEFTFEFTRTGGSQLQERVGKFITDACAAVGIRVEQRVVDWSLFDQILKTRDFDALIMAWSASAPESDPTQIWHTDSIQNQGHNFIQWDAGQDPIIEAIRTTLDPAERMKHHHALHRLIHEQQPYTFVRVPPWLRFISTEFANVSPYPKGLEQREFYVAPTAGI